MASDKKSKRLSISLNEEDAELIEDFKEKFDSSKAEVIRRSLQYLKVSESNGTVPLKTLSAYIDFLSKGEHVILDSEHWRILLEEIGEGSERFWEVARRIGEQHWGEYSDKGLDGVGEFLEYISKTNWFSINKNSESRFTLVLRVKESQKFVKEFLDSLFEASPHEVEIKEGYGKLRLKKLSD